MEVFILECWKDVVGFEGLYEVSTRGRVRSIDRIIIRKNGTKLPIKGRILPQYKKRGNSKLCRYQVNLSKNGKKYSKSVHRLVAMAFIPNPLNLPEVNHIDENPLNNVVWNLEWCSSEYNHNYGTRNARQAKALEVAVDCFDIDGNFVQRYRSIKSAAKELNLDASCITKVCKHKVKQTKSYVFEYAK